MNILEEAESLINGDRAASYGSPTEQYAHLAGLWRAYLGADISPLDAVNMMLLVKINRARGGYHRDSYVDTAGYAGVAEKMHDEQNGPIPESVNPLSGLAPGVSIPPTIGPA